jgi:hypothetical protein
MKTHFGNAKPLVPWYKGRLVGRKAPFKPKEIWAIRIRLQLAEKARDSALFNLAIDSELRGCDLVSPKIGGLFSVALDPGVQKKPELDRYRYTRSR